MRSETIKDGIIKNTHFGVKITLLAAGLRALSACYKVWVVERIKWGETKYLEKV